MATEGLIALYSTTLVAATSSIILSGIPQTGYRDLRVTMTLQNQTINAYPGMRFNGDAATNYTRVGMRGNGSTPAAFSVNSETAGYVDGPSVGEIIRWDIMDFSASNKHKIVLARADGVNENTSAHAFRWASTAAITSLTITGGNSDTYGIGTVINIYGIAG